jgi:hypothetical protein
LPERSEAAFPAPRMSRMLRFRRPVGFENPGEPEERKCREQEERTPGGARQRNPPARLYCGYGRNSSTNLLRSSTRLKSGTTMPPPDAGRRVG